MPSNLFICVRNAKRDGSFGTEPGRTTYLDIPDGEMPNKRHAVSKTEWRKRAVERATRSVDERTGYRLGDALVFVHGYNNGQEVVMARHDLLQRRLREAGYQGAIISFDWPSAESALNYLEDRSDAKATALRLVSDGIALLAHLQEQQDRLKCRIDVHLLGHSTGVYVIREAFSDADDHRRLSLINWSVSQVALIGGDISAKSLSADNAKTDSLVRHSIRVTNYSNPFDSALKLSNAKRVGMAPRVGRVGLPYDASSNCVNVDCGTHWRTLDEADTRAPGAFSHSWHFDDQLFARDLVYTLQGDIDRNSIPTRVRDADGNLQLAAE